MPSEPQGMTRREFLIGAGAMALAAAPVFAGCSQNRTSTPFSTIIQTPGIIYSPDTLRANRIPPGQHEVSNWPQVQAGATPAVDINKWTLTISGEVVQPVTISYNEFTNLKSEKVFSDIHCVTTWTRLNNLWDGFGSQTVANLVSVKPSAKFVIVQAENGFTTNLTMDDFLQTDVIFAIKHDDTALTPDHGWPVRLVVPRLYFWKSAKWVTGINFSAVDVPGFWETRGYNNHGDPWKQERYS
jgi:DMSO/TMAO reductase YedYZ molybdopterin-dependent catalytic subunit